MLGDRQECQDRLFYEFDLDDVVPGDHYQRHQHNIKDQNRSSIRRQRKKNVCPF